MAQMGLGDGAAAAKQLDRILADDPDHLGARIEQVRLDMQSGDEQRALALAEELVDRYPDQVLTLSALAAAAAQTGDRARAREVLDQALELEPNSLDVLHNLAKLARAEGDAEEARELYERMLDVDSGSTEGLIGLAQLDVNAGDPARALQRLEAALASDPSNVDLRLNLVNGYLSADRIDDARRLLIAPAASRARDPRLAETLGRLELMDDAPRAAIIAFRKLADQLPDSADAHNLLALAYAQAGNTTSAADALVQGLRLDSGATTAVAAFSALLDGADDGAVAEAVLQRLGATSPDNLQIRYLGVLLLQHRSDSAAALKLLAELHRREPTNRRYYDALLRQRSSTGDWDGALHTAKNWLAKHPKDNQTRRRVAQLYAELGKSDEAIRVYKEAIAQEPADAVALNNLATLLLDRDLDAALGYAREALALAPGSPAIADTLGQSLLAVGDATAATEVLRSAHQAMPGDPEIALHYATALARAGDAQGARAQLHLLLQAKLTDEIRASAEELMRQLP